MVPARLRALTHGALIQNPCINVCRRNGPCPTQGIDTPFVKEDFECMLKFGRNGPCPTQGIDTMVYPSLPDLAHQVEMVLARLRALTHDRI